MGNLVLLKVLLANDNYYVSLRLVYFTKLYLRYLNLGSAQTLVIRYHIGAFLQLYRTWSKLINKELALSIYDQYLEKNFRSQSN